MAHSLEARVPLLDHRLVELAFSLDGSASSSAAARRSRCCAARSPTCCRPRCGTGATSSASSRRRPASCAARSATSRPTSSRRQSFARARLRRRARAARERLQRHRSGRPPGGDGAVARAQSRAVGAAASSTREGPLPDDVVPDCGRPAAPGSSCASTSRRYGRTATWKSSTCSARKFGGSRSSAIAEAWHVRYPRRPATPSAPHRRRLARPPARAASTTTSCTRTSSSPGCRRCSSSGSRSSITEHWSVFLPEDPMQLGAGGRLAARIAFGRAALVLPVSEALQRGIEANGISARFRLVPNIVDTTLFHPGDSERRGVLAVGMAVRGEGLRRPRRRARANARGAADHRR